jgi:hypothetical protein
MTQAMQDVKDQHLKMLTLYTQLLDNVNNLMGTFTLILRTKNQRGDARTHHFCRVFSCH